MGRASRISRGASTQPCGLDDAGEGGDGLRTGRAAGAETDLAEDHKRSQGSLGMVVGGRPAATYEGEDFWGSRATGTRRLRKVSASVSD